MRLHHVAIAVDDLDVALATQLALTGGRVDHEPTDLPEQGVRAATIDVAGSAVELVSPTGRGGVQRFLERRGEGLHHVAYEVDDLGAALDEAVGRGQRVLPGAGRIGLHGTPVAFLHPADCSGVLVELVEQAPG